MGSYLDENGQHLKAAATGSFKWKSSLINYEFFKGEWVGNHNTKTLVWR